MTRTRLGLLGLCAMVFGLMAFSASAAQAEVGAKWLVLKAGGGVMSETEINGGGVSFSLEAETTGILHSELANHTKVLFECKKLAATGAVLKNEGKVANGAKIKFSECITKLNGATSAPCEPNAGGKEKGVINTNAGHALIELAPTTKEDIVKILPDTGETFATIEMSEECSIGTKVPVIGKATLKDCQGLALTHLVKHLAEVGPATELWVISKTAEHVATILGSGWATLGGTGAGLSWAGDPA